MNSCLISGDRTKRKLAKKLKLCIDHEMDSSKKCSQCYSNATEYPDDWFTMVCAKPHLIVWAKIQKNGQYLPAKLISIDGSRVHVRFFPEHTSADLSASQCFLYSEEYPGKRKELPNSMEKAKEVVT